MAYTTADYVYDKIGVTSATIPTAQMNRLLEQADAEVDRIIKTTCVPKQKMEIFEGNDKNIRVVKHIPLLSVSRIEIDGEAISIDKIFFEQTGMIRLNQGAEQLFFYQSTTVPNCMIKYYYGWLEDTTTSTEVATAVTAGANKVISVDSETGFSANDWVRIEGFDGYRETTKLSATGTGTLSATLIYPHEVDSLITKLQVPAIVQNLAGVLAAIMGALYMIGSTYTFATSYAVPDHQVTKGVPYPHFNRNMEGWIKERDFIMSQLPSWAVFS